MAGEVVNKVVYGDTTLIDLTEDTVTPSDVLEGVTFHMASGVQSVGTGSGGVQVEEFTAAEVETIWNSVTV